MSAPSVGLGRRLPPPLPARKGEPLPMASVGQSNVVPTRRLPPPLPSKRATLPAQSDEDLPSTPPPPINYATRPVFKLISAQLKAQSIREPTPPPKVPSGPTCLQCRDFSGPDAHAAQFPRENVRSLQELALQLTEPFDEEVDKARAIFTWLHYNIVYDTVAFFSGNLKHMTPEQTLAKGLAVCDGYAGLFEQLADYCGIVAHKVTGHGKGFGYVALGPGESVPQMEMNHAWNCVQMDGEWRLIDSCWGAGNADASGVYKADFSERWFISSPTLFGERHFPSDPSFQLTPERVMWEDYITAPEPPTFPASFFQHKLDPSTIQPREKHIPGGQWMTFTVAKRCDHMSTAERDNWVFIIHAAGDFTPLRLDPAENHWTAKAFVPRSGQVLLCAVQTVEGRDARGLGYQEFVRAKGRKPMTFESLAAWDVV